MKSQFVQNSDQRSVGSRGSSGDDAMVEGKGQALVAAHGRKAVWMRCEKINCSSSSFFEPMSTSTVNPQKLVRPSFSALFFLT